MPRSGNLDKPMTVERALAEAHKAGCAFRLAGVGVDVRGIDAVPADVVSFLREIASWSSTISAATSATARPSSSCPGSISSSFTVPTM